MESILIFLEVLLLAFAIAKAQDEEYYLSTKDVRKLKFDPEDATNWTQNMQAECNTVFYVHGWQGELATFDKTVENYAQLDCYNVIGVFWPQSQTINYLKAASKVDTVGENIGKFIEYLQGEELLGGRLQLVGHSLGAHVVGNAARNLKTRRPVDRVDGLDPAGPLFTIPLGLFNKKALNHDDAKLVVTTMTGMGAEGTIEFLGDVNFIANIGSHQPGCGIGVSCDHNRAVEYFTEAILTDKFEATELKDPKVKIVYGQMMPDDVAHGTYQFWTNPKPPYALG